MRKIKKRKHYTNRVTTIEPHCLASKFDDLFLFISTFILIWYIIFNVFIGIVIINGSSMEPTYYEHDRVVITRIFNRLKYGDVVVINLKSNDALEDQIIIKRVIATQGQTIQITEDGTVLIDGTPENGLFSPSNWAGIAAEPVIVPQNCVFVMGDNRKNSLDSRELGFIPINQIYGKLIF